MRKSTIKGMERDAAVVVALVLASLLVIATLQGQVRIGGTTPPDASAVLDLNATNAAVDGRQGLLLPTVKLDSATDVSALPATPVPGLLVCNTTGSLPHGVYFWDGAQWAVFISF
jgi:hypothetical protein